MAALLESERIEKGSPKGGLEHCPILKACSFQWAFFNFFEMSLTLLTKEVYGTSPLARNNEQRLRALNGLTEMSW